MFSLANISFLILICESEEKQPCRFLGHQKTLSYCIGSNLHVDIQKWCTPKKNTQFTFLDLSWMHAHSMSWENETLEFLNMSKIIDPLHIMGMQPTWRTKQKKLSLLGIEICSHAKKILLAAFPRTCKGSIRLISIKMHLLLFLVWRMQWYSPFSYQTNIQKGCHIVKKVYHPVILHTGTNNKYIPSQPHLSFVKVFRCISFQSTFLAKSYTAFVGWPFQV